MADFGLSKELQAAASCGASCTAASGGGANNPLWLAPEVLAEGRYTTASDVFSFGIVLWELLTLRMPWSDSGVSQWLVAGEVQRGGRPQVPPAEACPGLEAYEPYVHLMQRCWHEDPGRRPSFAAVCTQLRWVGGWVDGCGWVGGRAGGLWLLPCPALPPRAWPPWAVWRGCDRGVLRAWRCVLQGHAAAGWSSCGAHRGCGGAGAAAAAGGGQPPRGQQHPLDGAAQARHTLCRPPGSSVQPFPHQQ